jgi:hypothetical protein
MKEDEIGGACSTHRRDVKCIQNFYGKPEGKKPRIRPRRRCEDSIRMDVREIVWEVVKWMHLAQERDKWWALVKKIVILQFP